MYKDACSSGHSVEKVQKSETNAQKTGARAKEDGAKSIRALSKKKLHDKLEALGLSTKGLKADLRSRLEAALRGDIDDDISGDNESEEEEATNCADNRDGRESMISRGRHTTAREYRETTLLEDKRQLRESLYRTPIQYTLPFKDVEDALETFSGDGTQNIRRWFVSFGETAKLCKWSETQKVIYLKKLLRGSAKLFANYECHARSWEELKKALIDEFGPSMNSRQVHKELSAVVKKSNETYQEYVYRVLELASHSEIELESKIQYIIDGIKDETRKFILFGMVRRPF